MSRPLQQTPRSRRTRAAGWLLGAAAMFAAALVAPEASAAAPSIDGPSFDTPHLRWSGTSNLELQPHYARVMLPLPSEWMPAPDLGYLGSRGISLVPQKEFEFSRRGLTTQAVIGPNVYLRIEDRAHSVAFGLRLMPRSAVAVLRFDPIARLK